jgi:hypothetical protein
MTTTVITLLASLGLNPAGAILSEQEITDGFVSLFNGRDLSGWHITGGPDDSFGVRGGQLECTGSGEFPNWLRTDKTYENGAPLHGRASKVGMKIHLCDHIAKGSKTAYSGAILGVRPALTIATNHFDEWNSVEVEFDWPRLRVIINGKLAQDVDCEKDPVLRYRLRRGYLGLQDMGGPVAFRNLRIKELPSKHRWTSLFNGKNFDGWKIIGEATWDVTDGVIRAADGNGYLMTESSYQDFELHTLIKTSRHANGGIFFRWKSLVPQDRGYEIQIYNVPDGNNPTGSIYTRVRVDHVPVRDGEWFPMHIIVKGPKCVVRVNGEIVAVDEHLPLVRSGPICLQMHRRNAWIEFKEVRIRSLN